MKPSRIVRLSASNVKRLRAVEIEPDGSLVVIAGRNGQGKSSVLDSIWMALGGRRSFPPRPVRDGAEEACVELELDTGLVVTRRIKPDGQTALQVATQEGARFPSPQAMLDALVGELSFDPLDFARRKPAEQRELLRKLVGLDLSELEERRVRFYDERSDANREAKRLAGEISGVPHHRDAPDEEVSVAALAAELRTAQEARRELDEATREVDKAQANLDGVLGAADELRHKLAALETELALLRGRLTRCEEQVVPEHEEALSEKRRRADELRARVPELEPIQERLAGAEEANQKVRDNRRRTQLKERYEAEAEHARALTEQIEAVDREKAEAIAAASYPLEGLGVGDEGVLLDGVPFEQASSAEQLRASVAIGLALNPQLKVLLVRDGSLLDSDSLRLLGELASAADAQVWVERVDESALMGVVIEDGAVRGAEAAT
ncbi:MAG: AAA family ATPase [Sandaracinaceae bacterium]